MSMADITQANQTQGTQTSRARKANENLVKRFFRATEIDTRLLGMVGALIIIWLGFQVMTEDCSSRRATFGT